MHLENLGLEEDSRDPVSFYALILILTQMTRVTWTELDKIQYNLPYWAGRYGFLPGHPLIYGIGAGACVPREKWPVQLKGVKSKDDTTSERKHMAPHVPSIQFCILYNLRI